MEVKPSLCHQTNTVDKTFFRLMLVVLFGLLGPNSALLGLTENVSFATAGMFLCSNFQQPKTGQKCSMVGGN